MIFEDSDWLDRNVKNFAILLGREIRGGLDAIAFGNFAKILGKEIREGLEAIALGIAIHNVPGLSLYDRKRFIQGKDKAERFIRGEDETNATT